MEFQLNVSQRRQMMSQETCAENLVEALKMREWKMQER